MLEIPDVNGLDTMQAAMAYVRCGWYVGPVKHGTKHPGSVLGNDWHRKTINTVQECVDHWAGTDHGIFLHVGRSGCVVLDVDHPENLPDDIARHLVDGVPYQTTRVGDRRAHYVFAQPAGRRIGNGLGSLPRGWGDIRGTNGVIIVEPSAHPEPDGRYTWVRAGDVPVLPDDIASALTDSTDVDAATDAAVRVALDTWSGRSRIAALGPILGRWEARMGEGASRHGTAVEVTCWAAREAAAGRFPFADAVEALGVRFVEALGLPCGSGRVVAQGKALREWQGIVAWSVGAALADPGRVEALKVTQRDENAGPAVTQSDIPVELNIPEDVWNARPALAAIRQAAHSRCAPADTTLMVTLARLAAIVPPTCVVRSAVGDNSLNTYAALVGRSAAGKSLSISVAGSILPDPYWIEDFYLRDGMTIASGEGAIEAYNGTVEEHYVNDDGDEKTRKVRGKKYDNLFGVVDEGEMFDKLCARIGSTTGPIIRSMWPAAAIGTLNATEERKRHLPAHSYSLGLVIGYQYATVGGMLRDKSGTPQRFLFARALDPSIPDAPVPHPGRFANLEHAIMNAGVMTLPQVAEREIWSCLHARATDPDHIEDPLSEHWPRHLCKLAGLLAILDLRDQVTEEDWQLAHALWDVSCNVRSAALSAVLADERAQGELRRAERVETAAASATAVEDAAARRLATITDRVLTIIRDVEGKLANSPGEHPSVHRRAIRDRLSREARPMLAEVITGALDDGLIVKVGTGYRTVPE